jgi:hypothetical protein
MKPIKENGLCANECPFLYTKDEDGGGELYRQCYCSLLRRPLDYYDGWLALCEENE